MRVIGAADEFWRVRLTRVDISDSPDFEWRDDILYRRPPQTIGREAEVWRLEAVRLEDYEAVVIIAEYADREEAEAALAHAKEDLADMTKSQFEEAYLTPPDEPSPRLSSLDDGSLES